MSIKVTRLVSVCTLAFVAFSFGSTAYATTPKPNQSQSATPSAPSTITPTPHPLATGSTEVGESEKNLFATATEQYNQALAEPAVSLKQLKRPGKLPQCIWVQIDKIIPPPFVLTRSGFKYGVETEVTPPGDYDSVQEYRCLSNGNYLAVVPQRTRTIRIHYDPKKPTPLDEDNVRDLNMAITATKSIKLPLPTPGMAIRHNEAGTPYVYVNSRVWFWTDPKTYKPVTVRAQAGGTWVEATATPVGLGFNPRKGDPYFECSGPGDVYDFNKNEIDDRAPSGCYYIYKRITHNRTPVEARINIRWAITWRSNTAEGTLPDMYSTSPPQHFEVGELHNLVVG